MPLLRSHLLPAALLAALLSSAAFFACGDPPPDTPAEVLEPPPYYPPAPVGGEPYNTVPVSGTSSTPSDMGAPPPDMRTPLGGDVPPVGGGDGGEDGGYGGGEVGGYGGGEGGYGGGEGGYYAPYDCSSDPDPDALPLCGVCEGDLLVVADSDERCELPLCPTERFSLELGADGVERCLMETLAPPAFTCYDIDSCVPPDEQVCEPSSTEVIAEADACATISGCDDSGAPSLEARPNNALCNTWGTCNNGACSAPAVCEAVVPYNTFNRFCAVGAADSGNPTCTFYVDGRGASNNAAISCDAFCALSGLTCVDGWNDNNGSCNPTNNNRGCDGDLQTQVCVCEVPPLP